MKKRVSYFLISATLSSVAQVSDTLLPNHFAYWEMVYEQYDPNATPEVDYNLFNSEIYGPIDWNGTTWTYIIEDNAVAGLMRSDSGKVYCRGLSMPLPYFYAPPDTAEKLLYDFTMEIGDTAYYTYVDYDSPVTVESIGVSDLLGVPKKTWFLSDGETIVQGLGSSKGLFRPWTGFFESNQWICGFTGVYKDSIGLFTELDISTYSCTFDDLSEVSSVQVVFEQYQLFLSSAEHGVMQIYSVDGKLIYSEAFAAGDHMLDIGFLQSGIFLLRINDGVAHKFVRGN